MTTINENMVLRTIYLPRETDRKLKAIAFAQDISKGELIRNLITSALPQLEGHTLGAQIGALAAAKAAKPAKAAKRPVAAKPAAPAPKAKAPTPATSRERARAKGRQEEELVAAE